MGRVRAKRRAHVGQVHHSISNTWLGATAEEEFFVNCDRTMMTQYDIDNGRLICHVGITPVRPAEFAILRFSQKSIAASRA